MSHSTLKIQKTTAHTMLGLLWVCAALFYSSSAVAWELRGGLTTLEEGDDRLRTGVLAHIEKNNVDSRFMYFYRKFGPVKERTFQLTVDKSFPLPQWPRLHAAFGGALLREDTEIKYELETSKYGDSYEKPYNIGFNTAVYWKYKTERKHIFVISWQSAYYLAGAAGIFLVTARKQCLSIESGIEF